MTIAITKGRLKVIYGFWGCARRWRLASGATFIAWLASGSVALMAAEADPLLAMVEIDQLELQYDQDSRPGEDKKTLVLESQGWLGRDLQKFWWKLDAEGKAGRADEVELQALYSQAITPFWDLQLGLRQDFRPEPERSWGVVGLQGLAPYFLESEVAFFIGESGRSALRLSAEHDMLLTQRLVVTPELEVEFNGYNEADTATGSGLSTVEAGLRLRYEIKREVAPYIGVNWEKHYGETARLHGLAGDEKSSVGWVAGIRLWF